MRIHRLPLLLVSSLALGACAPNISGIFAADHLGDVLEPLAAREDPMAPLREACGELDTTADAIRREPYVQRVGAHDLRVTWTSEAADAETVLVWLPDSEPIELPSVTEPTSYLVGATQRGVGLGGLSPSTIYCYELHDAAGERVFGPVGVRTAPVDGAAPIRIAAFGDSGFGGADQRAVATQLHTVPTDFALHVGDIAYDTGTMDELEANHFEIYGTYLSSIPMFTAIGDHDDATDSAGPYREAFDVPVPPGTNADERWYSFDWGSVHVVVLDALGNYGPQVAWLEEDLAAAEARDQWMIAVTSYPPYSSGFHGSYGDVRNAFSPVFDRHHVHLVLSGDDHDYERSVPIAGVTYVVTGGGGRSVRPVDSSAWTAFSVMALHFTYITIEDDVMRVRAIDATGREFDGVEIPHHRS